MVTKNDVKNGKDNVGTPTTPEVKNSAVLLSPETLAGCVEVGGQAATPAEAARLTAACVLEHVRIAMKAQQTAPPKDPEAPEARL